MADKKMELIVKVNVSRTGAAVAATSVNTVGIVSFKAATGTEPASKKYTSLDAVEAAFGVTSEAYKMANLFFSQQRHPDSVYIVVAAGNTAQNIISAVGAAKVVDVYHWVLALPIPTTADEKGETYDLVTALNTWASSNFKMFHIDFDVDSADDENALKDIFGGFKYTPTGETDERAVAGFTKTATRRTAVYSHDQVAVKRKVDVSVAVGATPEGSKKVTVSIGNDDFEVSTTSGSTVSSIVTALVSAINDASTGSDTFTASAASNGLSLAAKVAGVDANDVEISVASTDSGVTATVSQDVPGEAASEYVGVSISADRCGADPARGTWCHKELVGVSPDELTPDQLKAAQDTGYNVYTSIANSSRLFMGTTCGPTDFIDTIVKADWIKFRVQEAVFKLLQTGNEGYGIDLDDNGIAAIGAEVTDVLTTAFKNHYVMDGYTVTLPLFADLPAADKAKRKLSGIRGRVKLMDSVHTVLDIDITAEF